MGHCPPPPPPCVPRRMNSQARRGRMERLGTMQQRAPAPAPPQPVPHPGAFQIAPNDAINWGERRIDPSDGNAYPRSRCVPPSPTLPLCLPARSTPSPTRMKVDARATHTGGVALPSLTRAPRPPHHSFAEVYGEWGYMSIWESAQRLAPPEPAQRSAPAPAPTPPRESAEVVLARNLAYMEEQSMAATGLDEAALRALISEQLALMVGPVAAGQPQPDCAAYGLAGVVERAGVTALGEARECHAAASYQKRAPRAQRIPEGRGGSAAPDHELVRAQTALRRQWAPCWGTDPPARRRSSPCSRQRGSCSSRWWVPPRADGHNPRCPMFFVPRMHARTR